MYSGARPGSLMRGNGKPDEQEAQAQDQFNDNEQDAAYYIQQEESRRTFGFEIFREWLQLRSLKFQNSAWGQLPFANSIDSIGREEYVAPEMNHGLGRGRFIPAPNDWWSHPGSLNNWAMEAARCMELEWE